MLGLFTFAYASIHLLAYLFLLLEFDFSNLSADILKRPYITVGFTAYLLLVPLAVTSNSFAIRLLRNRWAVLHRLTYGVAILVCGACDLASQVQLFRGYCVWSNSRIFTVFPCF